MTSGYRSSPFGFNMIPDSTPFKKKDKDSGMRKIENYATFIPNPNENLFFFQDTANNNSSKPSTT